MSKCTKQKPYHDKLNASLGTPFNLNPHQVGTIRASAISNSKTKESVAKHLTIRMAGVANALKNGNPSRHPLSHYMGMISFLNTCNENDFKRLTKPISN